MNRIIVNIILLMACVVQIDATENIALKGLNCSNSSSELSLKYVLPVRVVHTYGEVVDKFGSTGIIVDIRCMCHLLDWGEKFGNIVGFRKGNSWRIKIICGCQGYLQTCKDSYPFWRISCRSYDTSRD